MIPFIELTKKLRPLSEGRFLLAVSGGLDSMALLGIFLHFRKHFDFHFAVAHFHHGPSAIPSQTSYREQAHQLVKNYCSAHQIDFFSNVDSEDWETFYQSWDQPLKSESDFRGARYRFFESLCEKNDFQHLVLAHHQEDLIETRLLRLIRGTGGEGLRAMGFREGLRVRPLLDISQSQLQKFVRENDIPFAEDPSNQDLGPFRNWIRGQWLPALEEKSPGATLALGRSLSHIVSSLDQPEMAGFNPNPDFLELESFLTLSEAQKRQVLATYMRGQGLKNYGVSHINEILKRLDKSEKRHTFRMLGRRWKVDAGRMSLEPSG